MEAKNSSKCYRNGWLVKSSETGSAIVEFAIILPLLAFLILGVAEYTKLFKIKEFQALVTRETGTIAFRYCFERTTRNCETQDLLGDIGLTTSTNFEACLTEWRDNVDNNIQNVLDGTELTISFYRMAPGATTIQLLAATTKDSAGISPTDSHYVSDIAALRRDFEPMLESNEIIVIAESFVTFPFTLMRVLSPNFEYYQTNPGIRLYHASAY